MSGAPIFAGIWDFSFTLVRKMRIFIYIFQICPQNWPDKLKNFVYGQKTEKFEIASFEIAVLYVKQCMRFFATNEFFPTKKHFESENLIFPAIFGILAVSGKAIITTCALNFLYPRL